MNQAASHPVNRRAVRGAVQNGRVFFVFFLINLFILFLAALGLHCCTLAFLWLQRVGPLLVAVRRLLTAVASLVAEHGL